jgi:hypothetical protein
MYLMRLKVVDCKQLLAPSGNHVSGTGHGGPARPFSGGGRYLCVPWGTSVLWCTVFGVFGLRGVFGAPGCTKSSRKPECFPVISVIWNT